MMSIMIPVYIVNALYLWPITLWTYLNYGRPPKPKKGETAPPQRAHHPPHAGAGGEETEGPHNTTGGCMGRNASNPTLNASNADAEKGKPGEEEKDCHGDGDHMPDSSAGEGGRPMFATITIGVCHCGAGCVLGDIVGEWLVYGTNASIGSPGRLLWAEFLVGKYSQPVIHHEDYLPSSQTLALPLHLVSYSNTFRSLLWPAHMDLKFSLGHLKPTRCPYCFSKSAYLVGWQPFRSAFLIGV